MKISLMTSAGAYCWLILVVVPSITIAGVMLTYSAIRVEKLFHHASPISSSLFRTSRQNASFLALALASLYTSMYHWSL
jgi:hypothetical protein